MAFIVENIRLGELALIAQQNKPFFDHFLSFLKDEGYTDLHSFVVDQDEAKGQRTLLRYLKLALPNGVHLLDGVASERLIERSACFATA